MSVIDAVAVEATDLTDTAFEVIAARYAHNDTLFAWRRTIVANDDTCRRAVVHLNNSSEHAALLFFLLARGVNPVVLAPDSPPEESEAVARKIGASSILRLNSANELAVARVDPPLETSAGPKAPEAAGIYLLTSGSTGAAAVVFRSVASWRHEAVRYTQLLQLGPADQVLLASPIYHAYGLGWLWAVAEAGCSLETCRPTQLSLIVDALRTRATHCALTPVCASLLARRAGDGPRPPQLKMVMAGAGPVDDVLETAFRRAFGIGLSRNYGSTETGALFASTTSLPAFYIGGPMPNVKVRSRAPLGEAFLLEVELEDGRVVSTGDVLCEDDAGYRIIGRETTSIRRGESWISPFEIESVLRLSPLVKDCQVRSVRSRLHGGNDHIVASVVEREDVDWNEAELRGFCETRLRPSKVPDVIERVDAIRRTPTGKPVRSPVYRWAGPEEVVAAAGAYKQSIVVFALMEAIGLGRLNGEKSVDEIAYEAQVHAGSLGELLDVAERLGIVEETATPAPASLTDGVIDMVMLERDSSAHWNTVEGLSSVLRHGRLDRPFDAVGASPAFRDRYRRAMNGPHKRRAAHLVRRSLRSMVAAPYRLLDVSATGGAYAARWGSEGLLAQATCVSVGVLGKIDDQAADLHVEAMADVLRGHGDFNLIIFDNAVHDRQVMAHLPQLTDCLAAEGAIVIDDLFLGTGPGSGIGIDWLTHGGMGYPTQDCVDQAMSDLFFVKHEVMKVDRPVCHSVNIYTRT
jgi:acyl-CoA synthetase (AMP-forming)/AMP-acid ligase II